MLKKFMGWKCGYCGYYNVPDALYCGGCRAYGK